tara:strand:- start:197 stop:514 length:318 start_codon:yes stop_codon:yes gene_type:complete
MVEANELPQEEKEEKDDEEKPSLLANFFCSIILCWCLGVISYSYLSPNTTRVIDTTFAAGLLSQVLSTVTGIKVKKPGSGNGKNNKKSRKDPITGKNIGPDGRLA